MPFTFNGIGTTYYGARDFLPDGTYTTTEWFTFIYVPVIPLQSLRLRPSDRSTNLVVYSSTQYFIYSKGRPNLKQVLSIYSWLAGFIGCFQLNRIPLFEQLSPLYLVPLLAWCFVPWILRIRAMRKRRRY